jgi:Undecaprenyl-phosphate glucose phosphotransferase
MLIGCDVVAVNSALIGTYSWRLAAQDMRDYAFPSDPLTIPLFILSVNLVFMVAFFGTGLYALRRGVSRIDEAFKIVVAISLGLIGSMVVGYLLPTVTGNRVPFTPLVLVLCWAAAVGATIFLRLLYRTALHMARRRGFDTRRVVIVGAREPGQVIADTITRAPELGYRVQGFLSDSVPVGTVVHEIPVLGRTNSLGRVVRATQADEVIIALSGRSSFEVLDIVALAEDEAVEIKIYPDAFQLIVNNEVTVGDVSGLPLLPVKNVALNNPLNRGMKRALDIVVAALVLVCFSPIMLLIALLIRLESPGPVFFIQERVGLDGKPFPTIKFRTMRPDAPALGSWTVENDPRITALGAFLRRYSLDELPQFMNVLRGEMSVVGPRPEQPVWVEKFSQSIPRYVRRHKQKAGITGLAQVNGLRGDTSVEERTRYDLYYVENWSLLFDIKIIIKTAVGVISGRVSGY